MNKVIKDFRNLKYGPAPEDDKDVNKWIRKHNNDLEERCKWFNCKYDIDRFLDKL